MKKTRGSRSPSATPAPAPKLPAWIEDQPTGCVVRILAVPRASRTEIAGPHGEPPRLRIRVAAPPVDGEANAEIIRFIADAAGVPRSAVRIARGESGKRKDIAVSGAGAAAVLARLMPSG